MKTGLFFFYCFFFLLLLLVLFFAVKGSIVLELFFEGVEKPSKLHIHMHWNHS